MCFYIVRTPDIVVPQGAQKLSVIISRLLLSVLFVVVMEVTTEMEEMEETNEYFDMTTYPQKVDDMNDRQEPRVH